MGADFQEDPIRHGAEQGDECDERERYPARHAPPHMTANLNRNFDNRPARLTYLPE